MSDSDPLEDYDSWDEWEYHEEVESIGYEDGQYFVTSPEIVICRVKVRCPECGTDHHIRIDVDDLVDLCSDGPVDIDEKQEEVYAAEAKAFCCSMLCTLSYSAKEIP